MSASPRHRDVETSLRLTAPAKVNLGLRVLGTRDDGYHLLESLFVPLDLADELSVTVAPGAPGVALSLRHEEGGAPNRAGIPDDERNLAHRAAARFLERSGAQASVEIELTKRLPAEAGLGGGSSDAGAVLRALDELFPAALSEASLFDLALGLGADVPFFLDPRPCLVGGIGEQIEPLDGLPSFVLLLLNPGESASTPQVYGAWDAGPGALTPAPPGSTMRALAALLDREQGEGGEWVASSREALADLLVNDLEAAAQQLCPGIGRLQAELRAQGALACGMSGSGSTVYGVFADEPAASAAVGLMRLEPGDWARVARTMGS